MYTKGVLTWLKKLDKTCEDYLELIVLFFILVLLRIPNFFEPVWYGDEAIYLTIGNGLKHGLRLYSEIIDHKTPIIYYLAMVPNQFWFRVLNLGWTLVSTAFFFSVAKKLFQRGKLAFISTLLFVLFTTLPWLEGNIPNGELFAMGFVLAGWWLLSKSQLFNGYLAGNWSEALRTKEKEFPLLLGAGALFGLGVLTKVPSLLDFGAVLLIAWFSLASLTVAARETAANWLESLKQFIQKTGWLTLGLFIPILISVIYFVLIGSGRDYLDYGLLYNLRYSGAWQLKLNNPLLQFFFTLPGKTIILAGLIGLFSFVKKFPARFRLLASWFALTLFASLLSNRPYPHYLIQIVPPAALLLVEIGLMLKQAVKNKTALLTALLLIVGTAFVLNLLQLRVYSTTSYYQRFYNLITGQMTLNEYHQSFDSLVKDNYEAANVIAGLDSDRLFIWGTNPLLYALTKTVPASRFTVAFHIRDFEDYDRTMAQITEQKPEIIVWMKNEVDTFPQLEQYLNLNYYPNHQYEHFTLYLLREPLP